MEWNGMECVLGGDEGKGAEQQARYGCSMDGVFAYQPASHIRFRRRRI